MSTRSLVFMLAVGVVITNLSFISDIDKLEKRIIKLEQQLAEKS